MGFLVFDSNFRITADTLMLSVEYHFSVFAQKSLEAVSKAMLLVNETSTLLVDFTPSSSIILPSVWMAPLKLIIFGSRSCLVAACA